MIHPGSVVSGARCEDLDVVTARREARCVVANQRLRTPDNLRPVTWGHKCQLHSDGRVDTTAYHSLPSTSPTALTSSGVSPADSNRRVTVSGGTHRSIAAWTPAGCARGPAEAGSGQSTTRTPPTR